MSSSAVQTKLGLEVHVLRLGHRIYRDKRATTHLALAARALGASVLYLSGDKDPRLQNTIEKTSTTWGSGLRLEHTSNYYDLIESWKNRGSVIVHLTMYGIPFTRKIEEIRKKQKPVLVIVGGKKVPGKIYGLSDYNLSVTSQPHSEISSLAIFLDNLFEGAELTMTFSDSKITVIPSVAGKRVLKTF